MANRFRLLTLGLSIVLALPSLGAAAGAPASPVVSAAVAPGALGGAEGPEGEDGWLHPVQSEEALEKAIAAYLQRKHGVVSTIRITDEDPNDLTLRYTIGDGDVPAMRVIVDTLATSRDETTKRVLERRVSVRAWYVIPEDVKKKIGKESLRARLFELCNRWHRDYWIPTVYVDDEDDLWFQVNFNISSQAAPLHAEWVFDTLTRLNSVWREFYPELRKALAPPE